MEAEYEKLNTTEKRIETRNRDMANLEKEKELEKQRLNSGYRYVRCAKGRKLVKIEITAADMSECPECLQAASKQELEAYGDICKDCWHELYEFSENDTKTKKIKAAKID